MDGWMDGWMDVLMNEWTGAEARIDPDLIVQDQNGLTG